MSSIEDQQQSCSSESDSNRFDNLTSALNLLQSLATSYAALESEIDKENLQEQLKINKDLDEELDNLYKLSVELLKERGLPANVAQSVRTKLSAVARTWNSLAELHSHWLELMQMEVSKNLKYEETTDADITPPATPQSVSSGAVVSTVASNRLARAVQLSLLESGVLPSFLFTEDEELSTDASRAVSTGSFHINASKSVNAFARFCPGNPFATKELEIVGEDFKSRPVQDAAEMRQRMQAAARARTIEIEVNKLRTVFAIDWDSETGRLRYVAGRLGVLVELDVGSERAIRVVSVQPGGGLPDGCITPPADAPLAEWLQCLEAEYLAPPPTQRSIGNATVNTELSDIVVDVE